MSEAALVVIPSSFLDFALECITLTVIYMKAVFLSFSGQTPVRNTLIPRVSTCMSFWSTH